MKEENIPQEFTIERIFKMKKILSIIFVIVLILSVMPIAFAVEKTIKDIMRPSPSFLLFPEGE